MRDTRDWEEGRVFIDLDKKIIKFNVFFDISDYTDEEKAFYSKGEIKKGDPRRPRSFQSFLKWANDYKDGDVFAFKNKLLAGIY